MTKLIDTMRFDHLKIFIKIEIKNKIASKLFYKFPYYSVNICKIKKNQTWPIGTLWCMVNGKNYVSGVLTVSKARRAAVLLDGCCQIHEFFDKVNWIVLKSTAA